MRYRLLKHSSRNFTTLSFKIHFSNLPSSLSSIPTTVSMEYQPHAPQVHKLQNHKAQSNNLANKKNELFQQN